MKEKAQALQPQAQEQERALQRRLEAAAPPLGPAEARRHEAHWCWPT
jgi:hypothetical protein